MIPLSFVVYILSCLVIYISAWVVIDHKQSYISKKIGRVKINTSNDFITFVGGHGEFDRRSIKITYISYIVGRLNAEQETSYDRFSIRKTWDSSVKIGCQQVSIAEINKIIKYLLKHGYQLNYLNY